MDIKINLTNLNKQIPLFIDLPYQKNKELFWTFVSVELPQFSNYYHPSFTQVKMILKKNKEVIFAEGFNEVYQIGQVEYPVEKKILQDDNFIYRNGKRVKAEKVRKIFTPIYFSEWLDKYNLRFDEVDFYLDTVVNLARFDIPYKSIIDGFENKGNKFYFPHTSIETYNEARNLSKGKTELNSVVNRKEFFGNKNLLKFYKEYQTHLLPYLQKNKEMSNSFLVSTDILSSHNILSEGDLDNPYLDLQKIFRKFTTSESVPFVALKAGGSTKIKFDKNFEDSEQIKNWSLSNKDKEKRKLSNLDPRDENLSIVEPKGLLFKVKNGERFSTLNIYENGKITIRCHRNRGEKDNFLNACPLPVSSVIRSINSIEDAFINFPNKLEINKPKNFRSSMNIDLTYSSQLSKINFNELESNSFIQNHVLSDIFFQISTDKNMINLAYKTVAERKEKDLNKLGIPAGESYLFTQEELNNKFNNDFELSIRNHSSYSDAGLVEIMGITSTNKLASVKSWIDYLFYMINKVAKPLDNKKLSDLKNVKSKVLTSLFPDFDTRACQKNRQPRVDNDEKNIHPPEKSLLYKNNRFVCDNPDYPYPGFTEGNHICCFKTPQTDSPLYLENMFPETNFLVRPTNHKYETVYPIVLRGNNFYYIKHRQLVRIEDKNFVQKLFQIEKEENQRAKTIFLPETPLNTLITVPVKKNLFYYNEEKGTVACKDPKSELFYTPERELACYPYNQPRNMDIVQNKTVNRDTKHIITKDKILKPGRLGNLSPEINLLFEKMELPYQVFRYGVEKGSDSFLNAIAILLFTETYKIKEKIQKELKNNLFFSLENGELASDFDYTLKSFKKFLANESSPKEYTHYWDLISALYNVEIIIINKSNGNIISHTRNEALDYSKNFLFLLKEEDIFEPIVFLQGNEIQTIKMKKDSIFEKIYQYICNPRARITLTDIRYQILDPVYKNKVKYLVLKDNFYIPVENNIGPLANVPIRSIKRQKPKASRLIALSKGKYKNLVNFVAQIPNASNTSKVSALLTDDNKIVPVRPEPLVEIKENKDGSEIKYLFPINTTIVYSLQSDKKLSAKIVPDSRILFLTEKEDIEQFYHSLKYNYSQKYVQTKLSVSDFLSSVSFNNVKIGKRTHDFTSKKKYFQKRLEAEITRNLLILEGKVPEKYNSSNENEIIFTDIASLLRYLKTRDEE